MLTTVQDLGRVGYRAAGVPLSGAMDAVALRAANRLVGNPEGAAALEITLLGPELEFVQETLVAVQGAEFEGVPMGEARLMRAGDRLKFGRCLRGCRTYLAVAGGIDVSPVLGSRSTYLRGAFGGFQGRALRPGDLIGRGQGLVRGQVDKIAVDKIDPPLRGINFINLSPFPTGTGEPPVPASIRAVRGAQGDDFGGALFGAEFKVTPQSDRMGLRLAGPKLEGRMRRELISGAVVPGTVQVPPDGQPIVLMADAQILGGYPQAAHVVTADLPLLAQLKPGDTLRFSEITLEEAHRLLIGTET
jgi:antagonist of KipI